MISVTRLLPTVLVSVAVCAGCATHTDHLRTIRQDFFSGNLDGAAAKIDEQLAGGGADEDVLRLDKALVELSAGRPREAEALLRDVRDRFDYLEQSDVVEAAGAMLTDDNTLSYAGEDYEKILIRAMLALANLMHDGGDAGAYALQVADKQQQIVQKAARGTGDEPPPEYKRVALGAYIQGVLREQTHSNYDDVARAYAQVVSWEPDFQLGRQDLERATHGRHSARGNGVVYVLTMVGRGPYKEEVSEIPTTYAMLIADRILSALGDQTVPPTIAPIKVPRVVLSANRVDNVQVHVDGRPAGHTETITDVGEYAVRQYEAVFPHIMARAVARRAVKKGIIYAGKEAADIEKNSLVSLAIDVGGIVWEATESADTRCWGLLPDKIQVMRLELPAGRYRISLAPARGPQAVGPEHEIGVEIVDGRNTYLLANFPDERLVGRILTSAGS
jgi:hypothetical protein